MTTVRTLAAFFASLFALRFAIHFRSLGRRRISELPDVDTERYRPMLRLLSDAYLYRMKPDRKVLALRRTLFRKYLRELTADYGNLLAGLRIVMVESDVERPDLARILAKTRFSFALAACRIEVYLSLHAMGLMDPAILELEIFGILDSAVLLRRMFPVESAVWGA